jgi:hypothetical protein
MRQLLSLLFILQINTAQASLCDQALGKGAAVEVTKSVTKPWTILGHGKAGEMVGNALEYVSGQIYADRNSLLQDLEKLFSAIHNNNEDWYFEKFTSADRTAVGYVGSIGHFVVLKADGKLYKGRMRIERDLNKYGEWLGTFDVLSPVIP